LDLKGLNSEEAGSNCTTKGTILFYIIKMFKFLDSQVISGYPVYEEDTK
jgi:hypothetical protein